MLGSSITDEISNTKFSKLLKVIILGVITSILLKLNTHCSMKVIHNSNRKKSLECTSCIYFKIKGTHYTLVVWFEQLV